MSAWFRTHPYEEDRIAYTKRLIDAHGPVALTGLTVDSPRFQAFRNAALALPAPRR